MYKKWIYNHYGYSGLLVGHTNWGETSGRGVFTQLAHRAGLQGSHNGDDDGMTMAMMMMVMMTNMMLMTVISPLWSPDDVDRE